FSRDWSSDVCSSDLRRDEPLVRAVRPGDDVAGAAGDGGQVEGGRDRLAREDAVEAREVGRVALERAPLGGVGSADVVLSLGDELLAVLALEEGDRGVLVDGDEGGVSGLPLGELTLRHEPVVDAFDVAETHAGLPYSSGVGATLPADPR